MAKTLFALLQNSRSLSEADKKRIADQLPTMGDAERQNLERLLLTEAQRAQLIEDDYQSQAQALNKEYQDAITEFNTHTVKHVRVSVEAERRREDLAKAEEMLDPL